MLEVLVPYIDNVITVGLGGFVGWFFTRKKQQAETKVVEGDALANMQKAYNLLVEDMNQKFEAMKQDMDLLHTENAALRVEMRQLHSENSDLKIEIKKLKK